MRASAEWACDGHIYIFDARFPLPATARRQETDALVPADGRRIKALWFGYGPNIISLQQAFSSLLEAGTKQAIDLRIVTAGAAHIERGSRIVDRTAAAQDYIALAYSPESIAAQWERILEKA